MLSDHDQLSRLQTYDRHNIANPWSTLPCLNVLTILDNDHAVTYLCLALYAQAFINYRLPSGFVYAVAWCCFFM